MFCRLEAVPITHACASMIVVAERDLAALRETLVSIALQTVMPLDVTIAIRERDAEEGSALARAILQSALAVTVVSDQGDADVWSLVPRLIDDGEGAAIAIVAGGDVLAPGFLEAAWARFGAADGDTIAAVAVRGRGEAGTAEWEADDSELPLSDIIRWSELRATCFVYRREAMERVGGWPPGLSGTAARWDMNMRLAAEWRIGLLPACLADGAPLSAVLDQPGGAAFRSMQLRRMLRQSPGQLGLLMSLAQESVSNRQREIELLSRIDLLSRQVSDLKQMVARPAG